MFVTRAAAGSHVSVHGPTNLPPETIWKSMIHAAPNCYGQGSFMSSGNSDCKHITENERHSRLL